MRSYQYIDIKKMNKIVSLDEFEVTIIDLNNIWTAEYDEGELTEERNLKLLNEMIEKSKQSKVIFIFPQNQKYLYDYDEDEKKYECYEELKYMLIQVDEIVKRIFGEVKMFYEKILYENTRTSLNDYEIQATFYFESLEGISLLKSIKSEKKVCLKRENIILTTLDLDEFIIEDFIDICYPIKKVESPKWFSELEYFDDQENKQIIKSEEIKISEAKKIIESKQYSLDQNNYYKSILYSNGEKLVEVVFSILEKILNCNLDEFVDNKKEDFLLKFSDVTFIGEIKGIGTGVKSGNISQVDRHLQDYFDKLQEKEREENLKGILIINPQRSINPINREKVHETQIKLAERNGCLIILTEDLLKLYEKFLIGEVTTEKILEIFKCETGLFSLNLL
ncbi:MAG: hypothetical protein ACRC4T_17165 [Cetobacterium sp.]